MSHDNTIFNQLLHLIPRHEFQQLVNHYDSDRYVKRFTSWQQFITLMYAQIRGKDSLRDIETSLTASQSKLYHLGLTGVKRSTLSDANNNRNPKVFEELFYKMLHRCENITPKHKFRFKNPLYSIDSTVISLCLSMFPWAKYKQQLGALKMHCLYDHSGCIPSFIVVSDATQYETKIVRERALPVLPDSIIAMDKGYKDYIWLNSLDKSGIFFVTRITRGTKYTVLGQHKGGRGKGVLFDQSIKLHNKNYDGQLRLIGFYDSKADKYLEFLTNNFRLAASTIAQIYKARWDIELFFKWIKQHLKIKSFLGTSQNAVLTQIWIAMCYYLLLAYIKYQTKYSYSLLELARMFCEVLMERMSLIDLLSCSHKNISMARDPMNQLILF